jgi:hypothetical protein
VMSSNTRPSHSSVARESVWFSEFFGVDKPQHELSFVDFILSADVPLYIDPYAITKDPTELAALCHNGVLSYFQALLDAICQGTAYSLARLIRGRLTEPVEIHLGVSKAARGGRGIGREQEERIVSALLGSGAAKSGVIQAIQELELHIEGIGPDKISDLIANIILGQLAKYTEATCAEYGISTRPCAVSGFWNPERQEWDGGYFNLPAYNTHSYILVPKRFVRRERDLMNHREFYDKYVLEVIQRDLLRADDSLVQALKSGERRVTKKSIKEDPRFRSSKEFLSQFIIENPDTIEDYRKELVQRFAPVDPAVWSGKAQQDDPDILATLNSLKHLNPGREHASHYHRSVFTLVQFVFDWALENFETEYEMDQGRGRIDIIADNVAGGGLFSELRSDLNAATIPMECKNYAADLGNSEFNQLIDRLGPKTSRFGILFCRTISDQTMMLKHRTERWLRHGSLILLIDDAGIEALVHLRLNRDFHSIEAMFRKWIRDTQYGSLSASS